MTRLSALPLLVTLAAACLAAEAPSGQWEILFDGSSVDKWRGLRNSPFPDASWELRDDSLIARPGRIGRDVVSREYFSDFELHLEWKIAPGGNSGVKYLVDEDLPNSHRSSLYGLLFVWLAVSLAALYALRKHRKLMPAVAGIAALLGAWGAQQIREYVRYSSTGLEMQLLDNAGHPNGRDELKRAGALYGLYAPEGDATRPAGEWNTSRIVVEGTAVEHWINGRHVLGYSLGSDDFHRRVAESGFRGIPGFGAKRAGAIVLQHHRDEVCFRNIRIKDLTAREASRPQP